jgi:hypothetical protein
MPDPLDELREAARAALPPVEGELTVPGLREPVEVLRDHWGIPYLTAASQATCGSRRASSRLSGAAVPIDLALRPTGRLSCSAS